MNNLLSPSASFPLSLKMRTAFIKTLLGLAKENPAIMLLTGDLGFTVFEEFRDTLPAQYLNAGVMEQNMVGTAAGLAMSGRIVFVYSIVPFATFRCLEHIRNDVCYHDLPVCIVGVGGGYSYGHMGSTHHALEDIAALRALPNLRIVCPGDPVETRAAVRAIASSGHPAYLRLGKAGEPVLHDSSVPFTIGKSIEMRPGNGLTLIATGNMLETAVAVQKLLAEQNVTARLLSMHTVKPIDEEAIAQAARETKLIVTIEEHSRIGGLGSAVAEVLSARSCRTEHLLCAAPDAFAETVGSQQFFRTKAGLDPKAIFDRILQVRSSLPRP